MVSELFDAAAWDPVEGFDFTDITYHRAKDQGTVRIAFDRPEVRNAFRPQTVDELYRALDHARSGKGPAFIEAVTYRMGPHTTSDDPTRYRDKDEVERWRRRDPIARMRGTNGGSRDTVPDSIIPERGQVPHNGSHPEIKETCGVFHDDKAGSKCANTSSHFVPKTRPLSGEASAISCE